MKKNKETGKINEFLKLNLKRVDFGKLGKSK